MTALGKIVEIIKPDTLYIGQQMEMYATIGNIGDTSDNIFFRMTSFDGTIDTGNGISTRIQPGESTPNLRLWDWFSGGVFFRWWGGTSFRLSVWHGDSLEPPIEELDDYQDFGMGTPSGTIEFKWTEVEHPVQAPEGNEIQMIVRTSLNANAAGDGVFDLYTRMIDLDTGEEIDYITFKAKTNTSHQDLFTYVMPNKDFNIRCEIGTFEYSTEIDDFIEQRSDFRDVTILLGEAEGKGLIRRDEFNYPSKVAQLEDFNIHLGWGNFGEVKDMIFAKIIDKDTGELLSEYRDDFFVDTGRFVDAFLTMPERDLNLRIETGHEENGVDVVDDFEEITIISFIPATLNIDTIPVKGFIFVNGSGYGFAPLTIKIETGIHEISFGRIEGYLIPEPQTITVGPWETVDIVSEYMESLPGKSSININSTPSDSEVYLDENYIGNTPIEGYEI